MHTTVFEASRFFSFIATPIKAEKYSASHELNIISCRRFAIRNTQMYKKELLIFIWVRTVLNTPLLKKEKSPMWYYVVVAAVVVVAVAVA